LYHGIEDATWDSLNIDLASSAAADLVAAFQIFKTQARLKKQAILYFAAAVIALGGAELVGKINIPAVGFGAATAGGDNDKCKGLPKLGQESVSNNSPRSRKPYSQLPSHCVRIKNALVRSAVCVLL
jgi:hypothetical protein